MTELQTSRDSLDQNLSDTQKDATNLRLAVSTEDIRLSHESDFVPVASGTYYGGDQGWFSDSTHQSRGCGPVAGANITYYLSKQSNLNLSNLYPYSNITQTNFTSYMDALYSEMSPGITGTSFNNFVSSVKNYASNRGTTLTSKTYSTSGNFTYEDSCTFIKNGLKKDSPVATLNLCYGWEFGYHWMTITKYYRDSADNRFLAVSTWGERHSINYSTLYSYTAPFGGGLAYFY